MIRDEADEETFPEMVPAPVESEPEIIQEDISQHIPEEEIEEEEEILVHPEPKEILKKGDMFISTPSSKKNIKVELDEMPEISPVKKPRKKRIMTEEHKAKLALARVKGMETRKRNTELRRQAKLEKQDEKELVKKVKAKRVQKLKKELEESEDEDTVPTPIKEKVIKKENTRSSGYSQDDMTKAIASALEANDSARKIRKSEKKKIQAEEAHKQKIYNTVAKAIQPHDMWSECFT